MDSSEDEALFITQSSTNTDISAEIEGNNRVERLVISGSALAWNSSDCFKSFSPLNTSESTGR